MDPDPEDFVRHLADQRARMEEARAIVHYAHSRNGVMTRFLRRLAERIDPTGAARRTAR